MIRTLALIVALAFVAAPSAALAQAEQDDDDGRAPRTVYPKKTEIDINEGATIDGVPHRPHGAWGWGRRPATFDPLVKVRADFNPEMMQSVHEL